MWDTYNTQHLYKLILLKIGKGYEPIRWRGLHGSQNHSKSLIFWLMSSWIHQEQSTIDQLSGHRMMKEFHCFASFWRSSNCNCREYETNIRCSHWSPTSEANVTMYATDCNCAPHSGSEEQQIPDHSGKLGAGKQLDWQSRIQRGL